MNYAALRAYNQGQTHQGTREERQAAMEQLFQQVLQPSVLEGPAQITDMFTLELVDCDVEQMRLSLSVLAERWNLNPNGMFHGGILATAVDMTMGLLVRYYKKADWVATAQLNVNYLRPVHPGSKVIVAAKLDKVGARMAFLSADVTVEGSDQLVATATGVFV